MSEGIHAGASGRLEALEAAITELQERLSGELELGDSNNPIPFFHGIWVRVVYTTSYTATVTHNLGLGTPSPGTSNVNWLVGRIQHDGTAATSATPVSLEWDEGTAPTGDAITLTLRAPTRTVDAAHPLTVELLIVPAEN